MKTSENNPSPGSLFSTIRFVFIAGQRHLKNRMRAGDFKWDLGLRQLVPEWKSLFSAKGLRDDFWAGLAVSGAAVPLSLAIALASKVEPGLGLISAILGGLLCALFGGTKLSVSGPANSMPLLIAVTIEKFGFQGLLVVGLGCGLLQILSGILGLGRVIRYIPLPLVAGFTAGIGAIIFIGQLPGALGLSVPPAGDLLSVLTHLGSLLHESQPLVLVLALITIAISQTLPRFFPKIPASLIAVLIPSFLAWFADWNVPMLGHIPEGLGVPRIPDFPDSKILELVETSFLIFAVVSLESLMSSTLTDKLVPSTKHDSDQELIGQGIGNITAALFGGIPVAGVVTRSSLNVRAGAKTRRSAIFHSFFVLAAIYFVAPIIDRIPLAVLSGVLLSIAINMMSPKQLSQIWRTSPVETIVYWLTFGTIVMVDLMAGVQLGIFAALLVALWNLGQAKVFLQPMAGPDSFRASLTGNITFMASRNFELLKKRIARKEQLKVLVIDMSEVRLIDSTGASLLVEFISKLKEQGTRVVIKSLTRDCRDVVRTVDSAKVCEGIYATSESEIEEILTGAKAYDPRGRILFGVERYRAERKQAYEELFDRLGQEQKPHTLFITCSDSRINPNLITTSEPGELFIVRNVGNMVPPVGVDQMPAEGAAVEFALGALGVREIIVCGHTKCGALKGAFQGIDAKKFPSVAKWVEPVQAERKKYPEISDPEVFTRAHVIEQARNLLTYPVVREMIKDERLKIHCWIYDVPTGEFFEWTGKGIDFIPVGPQSLHGNIQEILDSES